MRRFASLAWIGSLIFSTFALPGTALAEAMIYACNESAQPARLSMRVFGIAWERQTLAPSQCQKLRISGFNLLFDAATLGHGAKLRLEPLLEDDHEVAGACEWKIDFGAATWQRHSMRLNEEGIHCIFNSAAPSERI
ncbi:MAG TPA: hypothetical protein VK035_08730 [Kiloniellales bacterium]|nr:hypothetical protein [Kiloniellales bacterium]